MNIYDHLFTRTMTMDADTQRLLTKIAQAYYEAGLTQEHIARRYGLSRVKVSRLLNRARTEGIVRITIVPPQDSQVDLERRLADAYDIDEAIVVSPAETTADTLRELGIATAQYLVRCLQGEEVISLTWGGTLLAVVDALPTQQWPEMRIIQALGGLGQPEAEVYGADLVHRMAGALGARPRSLAAPGIVASTMVRDALMADPHIAETLAMGAEADIAVVGIGKPGPESVVLQAGILSPDELAQLRALGVLGDIGLRFFDAQGLPVAHPINERIVGLTLDQYHDIPRVIGVAGTVAKTDVIRAALVGHLINVLVTDVAVAQRLIDTVPHPNTRGDDSSRL